MRTGQGLAARGSQLCDACCHSTAASKSRGPSANHLFPPTWPVILAKLSLVILLSSDLSCFCACSSAGSSVRVAPTYRPQTQQQAKLSSGVLCFGDAWWPRLQPAPKSLQLAAAAPCTRCQSCAAGALARPPCACRAVGRRGGRHIVACRA